ncbi:hypothetical protein OCV73_07935 [Barnesiella propionica]|uniref:hypothetical protein n=1 Tax=Barnesiella propionica TaxID=2981781 RepID=UPI0011C72B32|nr:hypothetical protein [Barnesiella propionica]MCU6768872.1 hypothetical protein [Barnesiella propionica]
MIVGYRQIANKINCYQASSQMLNKEGTSTAGRESEIIIVNQGENGRAGSGNNNLNVGVSVINNTLEAGKPIIVEVDYKNNSPNADGMTDHFVVISSVTQNINNGKVMSTVYNFYDPGTQNRDWGTSVNNTLSIINNQMTGKYEISLFNPTQ